MQRVEAPGSGPRSELGTRKRGRCLDGCYGNRYHSEVLCTVAFARTCPNCEKRAGKIPAAMKVQAGMK